MRKLTQFLITPCLMLMAVQDYGQNTTYGGLTLGAPFANLTSNPGGIDNTGFGTNTFGTGTGNPAAGGNDNTAVGFDAMMSITTGQDNTAVGSQSLINNRHVSRS